MSIIPCQRENSLRQQIEAIAATLKTEAHTLGDHGPKELEFLRRGLFRVSVRSTGDPGGNL